MVAVARGKRYRLRCCISNSRFLILVGAVVVTACFYVQFVSTRTLSSENIPVPLFTPAEVVISSDSSKISSEAVVQRRPTHSACTHHDGIYHIAMGDIGGAAGTVFFQFVIAQILYAERQNLKPWVYLSNVSNVVYDQKIHGVGGVSVTALTGRNATYLHRRGGHRRDYVPGPLNTSETVQSQTMYMEGTGVWEHYFQPVSDFVPGDRSCENKLYVTMDLYLITPGLHGYADYAPRCWRYKYMPDYMTKPHLGISEWLEPQRRTAHRVVQQYIRHRDYLKQAAQAVNPGCSLDSPCLGLHIRHSDKAAGRRVIETSEFLPFALAFLEKAGDHASIYLATDSTVVLNEIKEHWPTSVQQKVRTAGESLLRSSNQMAIFDMDRASQHHRTNREILVEIIALSQCTFLVHGFSAVSESAIWMNVRLHEQSINLEDPDHLNTQQFQMLIQRVTNQSPQSDWPHPIRSIDVWPELYQHKVAKRTPNNKACEGYDGVLLISAVGRSISAGGAFFTSVLNQLAYADKYNLKPWVHLRGNSSSTALIYDEQVHRGESKTFEMVDGISIGALLSDENKPLSLYPNKPAKKAPDLTTREYKIDGSGIWESYFKPVSDFVLGDASCRDKPLLEMEEVLVSPGLVVYSPDAVRAWRYDGVSDANWWKPESSVSLNDWYKPMRVEASKLIDKYYRFQPYIVHRAEAVNPVQNNEPCLGVHLRNGDKMGNFRNKIPPNEFESYVDAFVEAGGRHIYVASDSHRALQFVNKSFPERLTKLMRSQGNYVVRSTKFDWPAHYIETRHRVNSEVLVDILALSKCQILLHGFSTVSEAAIYLNPSLLGKSVNLEDPGRISPKEFISLVKRVI